MLHCTLLFAASVFVAAPVEAAGTVDEHRPQPRSRWALAGEFGWASYGFFPARFSPELSLDAQATLADPRRWRITLGPRASYSLTPGFVHSLSLGGRLATPWTHASGFTLEPALGLGYRHQWLAASTYRVTAAGIARSRPRGVPGLETALGFGLGYDASARTRAPIVVLVGYEAAVLAPFWPKVGVPVFMTSTVWLRLALRLGRPKHR